MKYILFTILLITFGFLFIHWYEAEVDSLPKTIMDYGTTTATKFTFRNGCGKANLADCPLSDGICTIDNPADCPPDATTTYSVQYEIGLKVVAPNGEEVFELPEPQEDAKSIYVTFNPNHCKVTFSKVLGDVNLDFTVIGFITCKW